SRDWSSDVCSSDLLDEQRNPLAERLVFSQRAEEQGSARVALQKEAYKTRDKVEATVSLQDNRGVPLKGDFSVAVTDDGTGMTDIGHSILATLLLSSDPKSTRLNSS